MSVYLLATLDTKGTEAALVRDRLRALGVDVVVVDAGCLGEPAYAGDVTREQVFAAAGTSLEALRQQQDRGLPSRRRRPVRPRWSARPSAKAVWMAYWPSAAQPAPRSAPPPCAHCRWASPS